MSFPSINSLLSRGPSIPLDLIRESNLQAHRFRGLVGVFVGGTDGIGESTLREFFDRTQEARAYIIGRTESKAQTIIEEVTAKNPGSQCYFIECDIGFIKNVDDACREVQRWEKKTNVLFLSAGSLSLSGRDETIEGIDQKMCSNYYGRMRFIHNLLPEITAAAEGKEISRVLTILAAGSWGEILTDDLDLRQNFTLHRCLAHCVIMTDFFIEELAKRHAGTAFSHSFPGTVKAGITKDFSGPMRLAVKLLYAISAPWILTLRETGERHFFQIMSNIFPPRTGGRGIDPPEDRVVCKGSDGVPGSGGYLLDGDATATGDQAVLQPLREQGMGRKVWDHTMDMFNQAIVRSQTKDGEVGVKRKGERLERPGGRFGERHPRIVG